MQRFTCECGNLLFFSSSRCLKCNQLTGYDPLSSRMQRLQPGTHFKLCANGVKHAVCNWLLPLNSPEALCVACRKNRTIPELDTPRNLMLWGRMEIAKRRLLYTLLRLGITLPAQAENPLIGLSFDIISSVANPSVTTGYLNGVITVNLEEADDTFRQINRQQLGENSRTLVGHFRHESAHYFWQRFLSKLAWESPHRLAFRERFGDEWLDYATALSTHYECGPPADWEKNFITGYAASHPWEDWAETWAHYLQIVDGLEACESLGIQVQHLAVPLMILPVEAGFLPTILPSTSALDGAFVALLQRWLCLSTVLNEAAHSLGEPPLYPYLISVGVAQKLRLAHFYAQAWGPGCRQAGSV